MPHHEDIAVNIDCDKTVFWHCLGIRQHSSHQFVNLKIFLIFSVDLLSRQDMLKLSQVPSIIELFGKEFEFHSAALWNGSNYICTFFYNEMWYLYDGLKEYNQRNTGLVVSDRRFKEPSGYFLSYLLIAKPYRPVLEHSSILTGV